MIRLAPLTVVFGRNNTGKSSILQSLLLLRQTLDAPEYGARLRLRGELYPAGSYADIVHQHVAKEHMTFEFGVAVDSGKPHTLELEFRSDEPQPPRLARLSVTNATGRRTLEIRTGRGAGGPYELIVDGQNQGGQRRAEFIFPVNRFLPLIGPEPPTAGSGRRSREVTRQLARRVLDDFEQTLLTLRAVGPFRLRPERRYEYQGRTPDVVDIAGRYVVNALIEDATRRGKKGQLIGAVNRWLKEVGRVRLLPFRRISKSVRLFELRLRDTDSGRWANFADVGFGIGQALPVFVEGLRTPPGSIFLVQEPEIHLHADAQLAMGKFLMDVAKSGRQVIAETHSESILLRLRRLIVEHPRITAADVSVVYVEKASDGRSRTQPIGVSEIGELESWPPGFMEDATEERLVLMREMVSKAETQE